MCGLHRRSCVTWENTSFFAGLCTPEDAPCPLALPQIREVYERAIANVPPAPEKRYWQRYIYLWMRYALWEELEGQDAGRTREVYRACLGLIPHASFTFAKVGCMCCACHPAQTLSAGVCDYLNQH